MLTGTGISDLNNPYFSARGSGMDTPLTALKLLFPSGKRDLLTYLCLGATICEHLKVSLKIRMVRVVWGLAQVQQ